MTRKSNKKLNPIPRGNRMLVKRDETEEKTTAGGIIIEARLQEAPVTGTITATGPDVSDYAIGERIIYARFAGHTFSYEDELFLLLKDSDVLCVLG